MRTEEAYVAWIKRFILFHGKRHPEQMSEPEINAFLSDLATRGRVSASTQNQALSAVLFLYRHVLDQPLPRLERLRLRVKDVDFGFNQIIIRDGKGQKDRVIMLPEVAKDRPRLQRRFRLQDRPSNWPDESGG